MLPMILCISSGRYVLLTIAVLLPHHVIFSVVLSTMSQYKIL